MNMPLYLQKQVSLKPISSTYKENIFTFVVYYAVEVRVQVCVSVCNWVM